MKKLSFSALVLTLLAGVNGVAGPTDWNVTAHITDLEATYMPASIVFEIDQNAGTASQCTANSFLEYIPPNTDNAKAVYALLLASKLSGQTVVLFGSNTPNGNGHCQVNFVHAH